MEEERLENEINLEKESIIEQEKEIVENIKVEKMTFKFSWGAFVFGWIYGIFTKSWPCLLALAFPLISEVINITIPLVISFAFSLICGVMGREWSYNNTEMKTEKDFKKWEREQKNWDIFAIILFVIEICVCLFLAFRFSQYLIYPTYYFL